MVQKVVWNQVFAYSMILSPVIILRWHGAAKANPDKATFQSISRFSEKFFFFLILALCIQHSINAIDLRAEHETADNSSWCNLLLKLRMCVVQKNNAHLKTSTSFLKTSTDTHVPLCSQS
jgi:hypothetical protein